MYRHSPNRNQRSKGFRLKHVLQICVLVAVCFWLIYQVKHSHDKRKQLDENNAKSSLHVEGNSVVVNLGRKDLISQEKVTNKDFESHDGEVEEVSEEGNIEQDKREEESREEVKQEEETEEEDKHEEEESEENGKHEEATEKEDGHEEETGEEETGEEETGEKDKHDEQNRAEDKNEEEDQEEDIKAEEKDEERRGDGDDEVEQEQEKADRDVDREEEFIDEEKEKEDPVEKVIDEKDLNDPSIEDHVHDEGFWNTREAREEQYKGDDASSAVTHDAQSTRTENETTVNQLNTLEHENKGNSTEDGKNTTTVNLHEVETAGNGTLTSDEEKKPEVFDSVSLSNSSLASITNLESNDHQGSINNSDNNGFFLKNEIEVIILDPSHAQNVTEEDRTTTHGFNIQTVALNQVTNSTVSEHKTQENSNSSNYDASRTMKGNLKESTNSSSKSEFDNTKNVEESNLSAESKDGSDSSVVKETLNEEKNENPDNLKETDGTYEKLDSSSSGNTDEVQYDSTDTSDPSVPVEDNENHIDLDTLPEIRTEGSNSEEVAEDR